MNYIQNLMTYKHLTLTEALVLLKKRIGSYAFNRFMYKQGFRIEYTISFIYR